MEPIFVNLGGPPGRSLWVNLSGVAAVTFRHGPEGAVIGGKVLPSGALDSMDAISLDAEQARRLEWKLAEYADADGAETEASGA